MESEKPGQQPVSHLGAPQPAHTSRQMQQTTDRFRAQRENVFGGGGSGGNVAGSSSSNSRPHTRGSYGATTTTTTTGTPAASSTHRDSTGAQRPSQQSPGPGTRSPLRHAAAGRRGSPGFRGAELCDRVMVIASRAGHVGASVGAVVSGRGVLFTAARGRCRDRDPGYGGCAGRPECRRSEAVERTLRSVGVGVGPEHRDMHQAARPRSKSVAELGSFTMDGGRLCIMVRST